MREFLLPMLAGMAILLGGAGVVLLRLMQREALMNARLLAVQRSLGIDQVEVPWSLKASLLNGFAQIGGVLGKAGVLSPRTVAELEQTLSAAGFRGSSVLPIFLGAKLTMLIGLPMLTFLVLSVLHTGQPGKGLMLAISAVLGMLVPDIIAKQLRKRYLKDVERGLPDALDMMVICTEAGLSLENSIERVGTEITPANRAIGAELLLCASELKILADRRAALMNMSERTHLEVLRRVAVTLAQSLQFGTPLSSALRSLSAEMRQEQLTKFEARAARLPVLLTLPMILFILPTLFLIVGGPAILEMLRAW